MSKELIISQQKIQNRIFIIQEKQVMVDFHLAELYQVETKRLNEQVKRNNKRFPTSFMFQLNKKEWDDLQSQIATIEKQTKLQSQIATTKRRTLPYVFSEQGVAMLSAVLNSSIAIDVSIQIINAFVQMRSFIASHSGLLQRIEGVERKLSDTDQKFEQVFKALENRDNIPSQGVFFEGQVFDAYELASKIIRSARKSIVLIDNYMDDSTLTQLSKKQKGVNVLLLSKTESKTMELDVKKVNEQYGGFTFKTFTKSHDRFLIIDKTEVYHLGASLKDLGKKWFAFSKMDKQSVSNILNSILELI